MKSLEDLLKKNDRSVIGIKLDIEGAEYPLLNLITRNINKIEVLIIEFHEVEKNWEEIKNFITSVKATHYVQHFHLNNFTKINKYGIHDVFELTIAKNSKQIKKKVKKIPIEGLDFPNTKFPNTKGKDISIQTTYSFD